MTYTTTTQVKRELPFTYQDPAIDKLTEDGYISSAGVFNEAAFLTYFVTQTSDFIDGYAGGPFSPNGVLEKINKILAVYEIEMYLVSSQQDRVVSVTIYNMWKNAMRMLDDVRDGLIPVTPLTSQTGLTYLVEPCGDGDPITQEWLDENVLFSAQDTDMPC